MVSGVLMPIFSCVPFTCSGRVDVIEKRQCNLHELPAEVERSASCLEELYLDCNQICEIPEVRCRFDVMCAGAERTSFALETLLWKS